jgi:DNA-binding transcriptional ArsR family regulator
MKREQFKLNSELRRNQEERANSRDLPNNYDENKPNIYKVIVADLEKLSRLKRFKRDGRKRFLWNYAVALSYNFKIGSATQLLIKKCNQLGLQYSKYQRQLQSAFKYLKDKSYQKYRLSVTKIVDQLEITDAEMLSLNLRALISPEVRKIIRRKDKAIERKQKTKPRSIEQVAQDRRVLQEKIWELISQKVSKSEIARRLGVSRSTIYRLL